MFLYLLAATLSLRRQLVLLVPTKSHLFLNSISESVVPKTLIVFFVVVFGYCLFGQFSGGKQGVTSQAVATHQVLPLQGYQMIPNDNAFLSSLHKLE